MISGSWLYFQYKSGGFCCGLEAHILEQSVQMVLGWDFQQNEGQYKKEMIKLFGILLRKFQ